ncbi:MAG: glycosyltransferase family 39 protein [Candidatus Nealsonbacteria bacterium]|nr:glycosyltransferase family 39 protein [Candidatus Nealsonbacteria bacterium]
MDIINQQFIHSLTLNLHNKIPFLILVNFILLLILIFLNREELKLFFKKIKRKTWIILFLIFFLALALRLFLIPHFLRTFYDEAWHIGAAERLVESNFLDQGNYAKGVGWPFILAIFFKLFGVSNWTALYTSSVFGALTIFNIFLIGFSFFKKEKIALWSAFLFSIIPLHVIWSGSSIANISSIFFATFALFISSLYFRNKTLPLFCLSLISLAFAAQFRQENYIYFLIFFIGLLIFKNFSFRKIKFTKLDCFRKKNLIIYILLFLLIGIFVLPSFIQVLDFQLFTNWAQRESGGKLLTQNWSVPNLIYNFSTWGKDIFTNKYHPLVFSFLFILGIIYLFKRERQKLLFLLIWFFSLFFIYFCSWPTLGWESRFLLSFYPITSIFAGVGIYIICKKLSGKFNSNNLTIFFVSILLFLFSFFIGKGIIYNLAEIEAILETKIPEMAQNEIPSNCVIVTNVPEMISATTDLRAIQLSSFLNSQFLENRYNIIFPSQEELSLEIKEDKNVFLSHQGYKTDCVLFFEDFYCEKGSPVFPEFVEDCKKIKNKYNAVPYLTYSEKEVSVKLISSYLNFFPLLANVSNVDKKRINTIKPAVGEENIKSYTFYKLYPKLSQ